MGVIDNQLNWRGVRPLPGIRGVWPAPDSVRVYEKGWRAGIGTTIVYTVPGGKILFISGAQMSTRVSADGAGTARMTVRDDEDAEVYDIYAQTFDIKGHQATGQGFIPALEAGAGYDVIVTCSNVNHDSYGLFYGWLEDA